MGRGDEEEKINTGVCIPVIIMPHRVHNYNIVIITRVQKNPGNVIFRDDNAPYRVHNYNIGNYYPGTKKPGQCNFS